MVKAEKAKTKEFEKMLSDYQLVACIGGEYIPSMVKGYFTSNVFIVDDELIGKIREANTDVVKSLAEMYDLSATQEWRLRLLMQNTLRKRPFLNYEKIARHFKEGLGDRW